MHVLERILEKNKQMLRCLGESRNQIDLDFSASEYQSKWSSLSIWSGGVFAISPVVACNL